MSSSGSGEGPSGPPRAGGGHGGEAPFSVMYDVFGARNVTTLFAELDLEQGTDAFESLMREATARREDPAAAGVSTVAFLRGLLERFRGPDAASRVEFEEAHAGQHPPLDAAAAHVGGEEAVQGVVIEPIVFAGEVTEPVDPETRRQLAAAARAERKEKLTPKKARIRQWLLADAEKKRKRTAELQQQRQPQVATQQYMYMAMPQAALQQQPQVATQQYMAMPQAALQQQPQVDTQQYMAMPQAALQQQPQVATQQYMTMPQAALQQQPQVDMAMQQAAQQQQQMMMMMMMQEQVLQDKMAEFAAAAEGVTTEEYVATGWQQQLPNPQMMMAQQEVLQDNVDEFAAAAEGVTKEEYVAGGRPHDALAEGSGHDDGAKSGEQDMAMMQQLQHYHQAQQYDANMELDVTLGHGHPELPQQQQAAATMPLQPDGSADAPPFLVQQPQTPAQLDASLGPLSPSLFDSLSGGQLQNDGGDEGESSSDPGAYCSSSIPNPDSTPSDPDGR